MAARESPLAAAHAAAGARLVEFAGWRLPLHFGSIAEEALVTRKAAGLFDISHMGHLRLLGEAAPPAARRLLTKDVTAVPAGCAAYALLCNEHGGVLDDLFAMVVSDQEVRLVVNAVNHDKDVAWLREHLPEGIALDDLRGRSFGLALQGPRAEEVALRAGVEGALPARFATFAVARVAGRKVIVSRTGYTGEDGFELFGESGDGPRLWDALLAAGRGIGLRPGGLGARDVLRQEMGYPLWGQELDEETTPMEAGLGVFVGRAGLAELRPRRRRIGFVVEEHAIARSHANILLDDRPIGWVTSGTYSPSLGAAIGQGYVGAGLELKVGAAVAVEGRGRAVRARVARLPLLPRRTRPSWVRADKEPA